MDEISNSFDARPSLFTWSADREISYSNNICHVIFRRPGEISALQNRDLPVHGDGLHGDRDAGDRLEYPGKCMIVHIWAIWIRKRPIQLLMQTWGTRVSVNTVKCDAMIEL